MKHTITFVSLMIGLVLLAGCGVANVSLVQSSSNKLPVVPSSRIDSNTGSGENVIRPKGVPIAPTFTTQHNPGSGENVALPADVFGFSLVTAILNPGSGVNIAAATTEKEDGIEPRAGKWQTWVLQSGSQFRLPAPPDKKASSKEIDQLKILAGQRDQVALDQIAYWNTSAPGFRWNQMTTDLLVANNIGANRAGRILALLNAGIYDATIAAWDSKYAYNRLRPSEFDPSLKTVIPNPKSPSYPSENAVVAGAASEILAYLLPNNAVTIRAKAQEAGNSFLLAGIQFPSDVKAGLDLGQKVAALVIDRAKQDGSDAVWDGVMPVGPQYWTGQNPVEPLGGTWKTWVLTSGSEFRPGPPIPYNSAEKAAEMATMKSIVRTPTMTNHAFYWEYAAGGTRGFQFWNELTGREIMEYRLDSNPPRAARAYALESVTFYDSVVAVWDAKYTYWAIRPFQLDPTFQPLFKTPNHPSYPAAHAGVSTATAGILAYLFPLDGGIFEGYAQEASQSRIWAGIHFPSDVSVGDDLGQKVADKVIGRARTDGSQQ